MEARVGLCVRIDSYADPANGQLGHITDLRGRIARVDFGRTDRIARWFTLSDLVDEFISQSEHTARLASAFTAAGIAFELTFEGLDYLERMSCRPPSRT